MTEASNRDENTPQNATNQRVAEQIFVVSAAMVGVCLTLMGLVGIIGSLNEVASVADELLAADAIIFLVACMSSYFSLRARTETASRRYERAADLTFIAAMVVIVAIGAFVALRII